MHTQDRAISELQAVQDKIGRDAMMFGNIYIYWREVQAQYYRELGKRYSSLHWTSMIIQKLWQLAWDQRDHRNEVLHKSENFVSLAEARKKNLQPGPKVPFTGINTFFKNIGWQMHYCG
jgi:lipopolysaccharide biosynthesis glycosyltransferase